MLSLFCHDENTGVGNVTPKTDHGKIATIAYTVVGIPLMVLYLSVVGNLLANAFRRMYGRFCSCCSSGSSSSSTSSYSSDSSSPNASPSHRYQSDNSKESEMMLMKSRSLDRRSQSRVMSGSVGGLSSGMPGITVANWSDPSSNPYMTANGHIPSALGWLTSLLFSWFPVLPPEFLVVSRDYRVNCIDPKSFACHSIALNASFKNAPSSSFHWKVLSPFKVGNSLKEAETFVTEGFEGIFDILTWLASHHFILYSHFLLLSSILLWGCCFLKERLFHSLCLVWLLAFAFGSLVSQFTLLSVSLLWMSVCPLFQDFLSLTFMKKVFVVFSLLFVSLKSLPKELLRCHCYLCWDRTV